MLTRIITSLTIIGYSFLVMWILITLYPGPEMTDIVFAPMLLLFGIITALVNFFILKVIKLKWIKASYFIFVYGFFTFLLFFAKGNLLRDISMAYDIWKHPEKIKYDDLFLKQDILWGSSNLYQTAALIKFKDSIPIQAYRIKYCCKPELSFYLAKRGADYITNNKNLIIDTTTKTDTTIFSDQYNEVKIKFSSPPDIFNFNTMLDNSEHSIDSETKEYSIYFEPCVLTVPRWGICKYYYDFLINNK